MARRVRLENLELLGPGHRVLAERKPCQLVEESGIRDLLDRLCDPRVAVDVVDDGDDQFDQQTFCPFVDLACHRAEVGNELARERVVLRLLDVLQTLFVLGANLDNSPCQLLAPVDADPLKAAVELLYPARPVLA